VVLYRVLKPLRVYEAVLLRLAGFF
jgi:hypothetical protein